MSFVNPDLKAKLPSWSQVTPGWMYTKESNQQSIWADALLHT